MASSTSEAATTLDMATVHELFEAQASRAPERIAIACGERRTTYGALDAHGNRLGHYLVREHAVGPDVPVAVVLDRGEHLLSSIVGILKAGGAYLPVEPGQPDGRIAFALDDSAATVVLTDAANAARVRRIAPDAVAVVAVDTEAFAGVLAREHAAKPAVQPRPEHLAYVVYTSGTTGTPNGVLVGHGAVVNYIANAQRHLGLSADHVCDFSTSIAFDLTVTTTVACLGVGGCVAVYPGPVQDLARYRAHLVDHGVSFVKLTPSYFSLLAGSLHETGVARVVLGGEKLGRDVLDRIRQRPDQGVEVFDEYGPTETTVGACFSRVFPLPPGGLDIGVFYDGCFGYVVDAEGRQVEDGEPGELLIGGVGLARGYLGRPGLTAERFVANPFRGPAADGQGRNGAGPSDARLYRTGDIVRRRRGGRLEYVGRRDDQVKVRGYRIEPGEIEAALRTHGDVAQAAVAAHRTGSAHTLVGYVVPGEFGCSGEELTAFLEPLLPEYMRPSAYVFLESLPLTSNGKLDRAALRPPPPGPGEGYVAPRSGMEREVAAIWADLLGVPDGRVGVHDEFLALGGDSIVAIQLLGRLRQALGTRITIDELFVHNTVHKLCAYLSSRPGEERGGLPGVETEAGPLSGAARLLPIQAWFFGNHFAEPGRFNQAFLVRTPALDVGRLSAAVAALDRHHSALRLRFRTGAEGGVAQFYDPEPRPVGLNVLDVRDLPVPEGEPGFAGALHARLTQWQDRFDLEAGPLHAVGYVHGFRDGSARIHVAAHHLVIDAVSWRIVAEDLHGLYSGTPVPPPGSSYRQWAEAVARYGAAHPAEECFWRESLRRFADDGDASLRRLAASEATVTRSRFELPAEATSRLLRTCHAAYNTQVNDVLLTAFAFALREFTGDDVQHIVLEGHGREDVGAPLDVSRTVGWFTTMFPVCLRLENDLLASLVSVKETLREIPNKGLGYGAFFGYDASVLPRINFNYLGQFNARHAGEGEPGTPSWELVHEDAGEAVSPANHDPNLMTINGLVIDGRLRFTIASKLGRDTAAAFTSRYRQTLERLIEQTTATGRRFLTRSDVGYVVSSPVLDALQEKREVQAVYRANSLQQGFIYHAVAHGREDDAYVVQMRWTYGRAIDPDRLRRAWEQAQRTFPGLRLRFDWEEDLVQVVDRSQPLDWHCLDLGDLGPDGQEAAIRRLGEQDRNRAYDLASGPLFRLYLARRSADRFTCLFSHHHAILDGWSITLLLDFVHEVYGAPETVESPPDPGYLRAQEYLRAHHADDAEFWAREVEAYDERPSLHGLTTAAARRGGNPLAERRGARETASTAFTIGGPRHAALKRFAQENDVTLNALLLYCWHKALHVFGGGRRTATGVVVSGRALPVDGIDGAVGLLINTLPSIVEHGDDEVVVAALQAVQRKINQLNERCAVDLASLSGGGEHPFDTLFIYENWPAIGPDGWRARLGVRFEEQVEKLDYPLAAVITESVAELTVRIAYAGEVFDPRYVEELRLVQETLLDQLAAGSGPRWADLSLLPPAETERREPGSRSPDRDLPRSGVFHRRFEHQARRTPGRDAVRCGGTSLTYGELDARAGRLASLLAARYRVRREEPVILCLDRGLDVFVAMLAVMKAGGAYVPVDPAYPVERIAFIVGDTAARVVITHGPHRAKFEVERREDGGLAVLDLDDAALEQALASHDEPPDEVPVDGSNAVNVIYTSGTTGRPKGVVVEHGSLCLAADAVRARFFAARDRVSTFSITNFAFDIFGLEYALPLLSGGTVELGAGLPETLSCRGLDFIQATPSVLDLLLDRLTDVEGTLLLCGGEPLGAELLGRVMARSVDLAHVYGPTESTIWSTGRLYRHAAPPAGPWVDLGRPFANERVFVLDSCLRPVPAGATGELCIGGDGLARGYLNRPELTGERFVPGGPAGERIYRTGDLVRLHAGGELEFVGRNDFQVKIRGHRIELGEIEGALAAFPGVRQCVVVVRDGALVGYYAGDGELDAGALPAHLHRLLPDFMVPAALVRLDGMPLTPSGKLDRGALPAPGLASEGGRTPPRTPRESGVRAAWARCLGLDAEQVGIDDDFFSLGGDSIRSIRVCGELRRTLDIGASVAYLHEHRTIRRFVDGLGLPGDDRGEIRPRTVARPEDQVLSSAQERLWFVEGLSRGTAAYNVPLVLRVGDDADPAVLAASIAGLVDRHEALRTVFREADDGSIYQVVQDGPGAGVDLEAEAVADAAALDAALRREALRPFDLAQDRPFRARLYRAADSGARFLCVVVHHIAFDGWSIDVLLRDLLALYRLHEAGRSGPAGAADLPELGIRYRDYALWERDFLARPRLDAHLRFWRRYLDGHETLRLPTDHPRPEVPDFHGANHRFAVDERTSSELRQLARELRVSLFSVLLSAYYVTLRCYCHQDDIVVGAPVANRDHGQLENLIGVFVNPLPMRQRVDPRTLVCDFIRDTGRDYARTLQHQRLPFETLVEAMEVVQDRSRHPVYQVLFDVQSFGHEFRDRDAPFSLAGKAWEFSTVAKHDLSIFIDDSPDGLAVFVNYATSLFREETIASVAETYGTILRQFAALARDVPARWHRKLRHLSHLGAERRRRLVENAGGPAPAEESRATLCGRFEEQAAARGDSVAVVAGATRLTYGELNRRANRLAHYLRGTCGVVEGAPVLLCLDRGADMIVAILAVLKAGGAYVPVEPSHPDRRIGFVLGDCGARVVLTHERHRARMQPLAGHEQAAAAAGSPPGRLVLAVDAPSLDERLEREPTDDPVARATFESAAYVIYTSGSTGAPKGVLQVHKNVVRLFEATQLVCEVAPDDVWLLFHSYGFDFSVWEIWGALLHGGRLVVPSHEEVRDPERLHDLCSRTGVTVLNQTPAAFGAWMQVALAEDAPALPALRYVFIGGEKWNVDVLVPWFRRFGDRRPRIVHVYGPTETTVFATMQPFVFTGGALDPSIGPILPNMAAYVVDPELRPVPVGAIGELCIGGTGVAAGYLNRDELTAEVFLANPFQTEAERRDTRESRLGRNARIYRSGDLVRRAADGRLTYVGRNDFQVKVQGHRIELGEIEAAVTEFPGVSRCVAVTGTESGGERPRDYLAAYYVAGRAVDENALREHLAGRLPPYMLPSVLRAIERMPLTASGKIDRAALPGPETAHAEGFTEPRTPRERRVRRIVADILALDEETLSVQANFFGLGGNSLKSIRLVSRLNREFGADVSIATLFRSPSVAGLARQLEGVDGSEKSIPKHRPADPRQQVLSHAQERLWFIDQYERGTSTYNIGLTYALADGVDLEALDRSLRAIHARHEPLRTLIRYGGSGPYQMVLDAASRPLEIGRRTVSDPRHLDRLLACDVEEVFDLANDTPLRARFYHLGSSTYLGLVIHHIAFDGWSVEVMLSELEALYRFHSAPASSRSSSPDLPELAVQYRDFAAWERERLSGEVAARAVAYWKGRLEGHEPLTLPTDRPRPQTTSYQGAEVAFELTEATTAALRRLAAELKVSLFSVLLSAYYVMLRAFSHQDDVIVGVPIANRAHGQVESLIGCFLNTLALAFRVEGGARIVELIRSVAARINEGRQHQELPFERLVAELGLAVDPSRHPVFQVTFDVNSFVRSHFAGDRGREHSVLRFYRPEQGSSSSAKFDLSAFVDDSGDRLQGTFTYATRLFDPATIDSFLGTYSLLARQFGDLAGRTREARERVSDLALLSDDEYRRIVHGWGEGERIPRAGTTVLDLFEEQVRRVPEATAVVFGDRSLSYRELDAQSSRLARVLRNAGVGLDDLVVLCLERSERVVVAILAAWKAGGAYVPVDPEHPDGRMAYVLGDTAAKAVLCDQGQKERWERLGASGAARILAVDGPEAHAGLAAGERASAGARPTGAHLAYVIYTSGTSGEAKGVLVEHGSLANLHADQTARYRIGEGGVDEVILQVSNYIFDASVEQLVLALPNGHTLLLVPNRLWLDGEKFRRYLRRNRVTHISATPTFLSQFEVGPLPSLRRYVVGGEALDPACHRKILDANDVDVFNQYGPTEITVTAIGQRVVDGDVAIGRPMANTKSFVLSADRVPVPVGAVGELYIGGVGVARGYLDKPELTEASFLANPFQTEDEKRDRAFGPHGRHARLYRTGDMVRWRRDGVLDYLGRVDQQVKVLGHRVELGEVNAVLSACPGVARSIVVTNAESGQLIAYYTSEDAVDEASIAGALRRTLPEYMVPAFLVRVDEIPMTSHGKLDPSRLPAPRLARRTGASPPLDPLEARIRHVWADVLGVGEEDLSAEDEFFSVGGNSILAIRLVSGLSTVGRGELAIADVFAHRTIRAQGAALLRSARRGISALNAGAQDPCLFMVHPAHAGSEVYASLARRLEGRFQCFGIDSHNLGNAVKIEALHDLAALYLNEVEAVMEARREGVFRLLGWSLGGQIALEMAVILEARGIRDIEICLLDTIVPDERLAALAGAAGLEAQKLAYGGRLARAGYDGSYVATVLANFRTDAGLSAQPLSGSLEWSNVLLFKALAKDPQAAEAESDLHEYVASLDFNNVDRVHQDATRLRRIVLADAHHFGVLDRVDEIASALGTWLPGQPAGALPGLGEAELGAAL